MSHIASYPGLSLVFIMRKLSHYKNREEGPGFPIIKTERKARVFPLKKKQRGKAWVRGYVSLLARRKRSDLNLDSALAISGVQIRPYCMS